MCVSIYVSCVIWLATVNASAAAGTIEKERKNWNSTIIVCTRGSLTKTSMKTTDDVGGTPLVGILTKCLIPRAYSSLDCGVLSVRPHKHEEKKCRACVINKRVTISMLHKFGREKLILKTNAPGDLMPVSTMNGHIKLLLWPLRRHRIRSFRDEFLLYTLSAYVAPLNPTGHRCLERHSTCGVEFYLSSANNILCVSTCTHIYRITDILS